MYTSTQQADDAWNDYFAGSDSIRERYACQLEDARREVMIEEEMHSYYNKVWESGFGTDCDAYEAYWKRTLDYYEQYETT